MNISKSTKHKVESEMDIPIEGIAEVKLFGTGAHISVPKAWFGRKVRVSLINEPKKKAEGNVRLIDLDKNAVEAFADRVIENNKEVFDKLSRL